MENTHASTHSNYQMQLDQVFEVDREGENDRFKSFRKTDRMLLWHGSRLTNFVGILSQGLRIAPPEAPVTGYMFGKGVYFADCVSKSANYCYPSRDKPSILLLCEVAVGKSNELTQSDYYANKLPKGKLSTKGCGGMEPNPEEAHTMADGTVIPKGKLVKVTNRTTSLLYNEFIVYDVSQIRIRYLLRVNMKFN
jgi:poly [ADP-ribose] polymerase